MKIGILGAGISGLSAAAMLLESGVEDVCVLERDPVPGGLASSRIIDGYVFDLHGGHVFNTKYDDVRRWVFGRMPESEWVYQQRRARVWYKGRLVDYPFEFGLYQLDPKEGAECVEGFRHAGKGDEPPGYRDWLIWQFGRPVAEKYMIPYNEKIMSYDLAEMSSSWVRGKMPLPSFKEVEKAFLQKDPSEKVMPHTAFYYPRRGGIQSLIDRISAPIRSRIVTGYCVEQVERVGGKWLVNGERAFDILIATLPLKALVRMMPQAPSEVKHAGLGLRTNTLTTTLCTCASNPLSWLYVPDKKICFHRMVFQGNFSPDNCPPGSGSSVILESTGKVDPKRQLKDAQECFGPLAFDIGRVIGSTYGDSYILYDRACAANLSVINAYIRSTGIHCLGRFAQWEYYNMDVCIQKAFQLTATIIKGMEELKV